MKIIDTPLAGAKILEPNVFTDTRGYFSETYNRTAFHNAGITTEFVQDNQSFSKRGILRGLHFQTGEHAQAKLVRVAVGTVLDVIVDIRPESPTFGQHTSVELSAENHRQLYIPRGFAHGFLVLSETALFIYKCDNFYHKESEAGLRFNDPAFNINWQLNTSDIEVNERDANFPLFTEFKASLGL